MNLLLSPLVGRAPMACLLLSAPAWAGVSALASTVNSNEGEEVSERFAEDVTAFRGHMEILAHENMGGRLPGTPGMEMAKAYMEHHYRSLGLEAPFDTVMKDGEGRELLRLPSHSYRQPFELAGTSKLLSQTMEIGGETFEAEKDFQALSLGGSGDVTAPAVFVGYSINRGKDGYRGFEEDDDLTGKIAIMMRFEPMDESGKSLWGGSPWTARASFNGKVREAVRRGAAGILIVQTPGADDERTQQLSSFRSGGGKRLDGPVMMVSTEAAERLMKYLGSDMSLMDLRQEADQGRSFRELGGKLRLTTVVERKPVLAENVGAVLPGKGELADEYVVIGAHLDHLGMGNFGSRASGDERGKVLHPGADDNASGNAALILLAERLKADYEAMPEGSDVRSILFLSLSAEESGLNGANHYVENPIASIDTHQLMINFDMIGRIANNRLSVSGAGSGTGLAEFLAPYFERTPLEIEQPEGMAGGSDHLSFMRKEVPWLFGIIADFHDDYHTPRDTVDKINHEDSVHTVELFHGIALGAAQRAERFEFVAQQRRRRTNNAAASTEKPAQEQAEEPAAPTRAAIKVRFGIQPAGYGEDVGGVGVASVSEGGSAAEGGVLKGDRIVEWNGKEVADVASWMVMLGEHEPGDDVKVTVERDGKRKILYVSLQAK